VITQELFLTRVTVSWLMPDVKVAVDASVVTSRYPVVAYPAFAALRSGGAAPWTEPFARKASRACRGVAPWGFGLSLGSPKPGYSLHAVGIGPLPVGSEATTIALVPEPDDPQAARAALTSNAKGMIRPLTRNRTVSSIQRSNGRPSARLEHRERAPCGMSVRWFSRATQLQAADPGAGAKELDKPVAAVETINFALAVLLPPLLAVRGEHPDQANGEQDGAAQVVVIAASGGLTS
jgi:hypothetical protein